MSSPRGILRNKDESKTSPNTQGELDRQEVIRNTRLNAQLNADSSKGDKIRAKIAEVKGEDKNSDHLKWDEINLYKTEQEKAATMKIDEPKTPYEGGFNPEGEYYQNDDDEESIPLLSLGEGQYEEEAPEEPGESGSAEPDEAEKESAVPEEEQEPEEQPLSAEERHKKFEEMRKSHYHMAGNPLKQKIEVSDDEE